MKDEILKGSCFHCEQVALMNVRLEEENAQLREALEQVFSEDRFNEDYVDIRTVIKVREALKRSEG